MESPAAPRREQSPDEAAALPELSPRVASALRRVPIPEEGIQSVRKAAHSMFGRVGMTFDFMKNFEWHSFLAREGKHPARRVQACRLLPAASVW